jgi:hypothetical protein
MASHRAFLSERQLRGSNDRDVENWLRTREGSDPRGGYGEGRRCLGDRFKSMIDAGRLVIAHLI